MIPRSMRYLLVGTYNAGVGYLFFYLINYFFGGVLHYLAVLVVSYFLSIIHAYIGQRLLVFRSTSDWRGECLRFFMVNLSAMAGNGLLLILLVEWGMGLLVAQAISVVFVTVLSYFGHRHFSFRLA